MPYCQAQCRKQEERERVCAPGFCLWGKFVSFRKTREVTAAIPVLNLHQRSVSEISRSCGCEAGPKEIALRTDGKVVFHMSDLQACGLR